MSHKWYLGSLLCHAWTSFDMMCCTASILHLVAISLDRYWVVTRVEYVYNRPKRTIVWMIVLSWSVALAIPMPPLFGWKSPAGDPTHSGSCFISQEMGYVVFATLGAFYLPFTLMVIIYCKIYAAAKSRIRKKLFKKEYKNSAKLENTTKEADLMMVTRLSVVGYAATATTTTTAAIATELSRPKNDKIEKGSTTQKKESEIIMENPSNELVSQKNSAGKQKRFRLFLHRKHHTTIESENSLACDSPVTPVKFSSARQFLLRGSSRNVLSNEERVKQKQEQKRERKAARTLAIVTGTFIICWLPFFIVETIRPFCAGPECSVPGLLTSVVVWLGYVNSLLNPVIYTIFNPEFRTAFNKLLFRKCSSVLCAKN